MIARSSLCLLFASIVGTAFAAPAFGVATDDKLLAQAGPDAAEAGRARPPGAAAVRFGIDDLLIEGGALPQAPETDAAAYLRAQMFALWQPQRAWEFRAGARLDGKAQFGEPADYNRWRGDLTDTYARWRGGDTRITVGTQTIVWGRVDEIPLIDRVSRIDLTRFILDDLPARRRTQLAARWEQTLDDIKLDAVVLPRFRAAALPAEQSVWSPVNRTTGEVIGIAPNPELSAFVRNAAIDEIEEGSGGGAVRLTGTGDAFDWGLTLARTRQSAPYYRADVAEGTLTAVHPYSNFVGADAEWVAREATWRTELGYTADVPVTRQDASMSMSDAVEWVGAVEFFPGGEDTRVNLQLLARSLRTDESVLELKHYVGINGEVESTFGAGRWKAGLRFAFGLNVNDLYVAPAIRFVGWEPHELYLVGHFFQGEARTLGGFHRDHDYVALGWRTRF